MKLKLYHYWRSSASWRVRWAFALKNIECDFEAINLLTDDVESPAHRARNPLGQVPVLELIESNQTHYISQSLAIIDWAENLKPNPSVYPKGVYERALCIQLAETINADTAPLQGLGPQAMVSDDPEKRKAWAKHFIENGLSAYETLLATNKSSGAYSIGNSVTLADICLIPQVYNALRYDVKISNTPLIEKIYQTARATEMCKRAAPEAFEPKP